MDTAEAQLHTDADPTAANKILVTRYIAAYSDLTGLSSGPLLHKDAKIYMMTRSDGLPFSEWYTKDEYLNLFLGMSTVLPNGIVHEMRSIIAEGDWVAAETECFAELPHGRKYNNLFYFAVKIVDGQIIEIREYCDYLHVQQALFTATPS